MISSRLTVALPPSIGKYPTAERVTAHVALALGKSEGSAHQLLYGTDRAVNKQCATIITALIQSGDRGAFAHFMAPIDAAVRGMPAPADSDELTERSNVADSNEECVQSRYERCPCEKHAKEYVLALDTERALNLERRAAVAARWLA